MNTIIVLLVHKRKNARKKACETNTTGAYLSYRTRTRRERKNPSTVKDSYFLSRDMTEKAKIFLEKRKGSLLDVKSTVIYQNISNRRDNLLRS